MIQQACYSPVPIARPITGLFEILILFPSPSLHAICTRAILIMKSQITRINAGASRDYMYKLEAKVHLL